MPNDRKMVTVVVLHFKKFQIAKSFIGNDDIWHMISY